MLTISQKSQPNKRWFRKFDYSSNENENPVVVILQEPEYFDLKIEPALVIAANYILEFTDFNVIYFFNNLPCKVSYFGRLETYEQHQIMGENLYELLEILENNPTINTIIDGRGALSNQIVVAKKYNPLNIFLDYFMRSNDILCFRHENGSKCYPCDRHGDVTEIS